MYHVPVKISRVLSISNLCSSVVTDRKTSYTFSVKTLVKKKKSYWSNAIFYFLWLCSSSRLLLPLLLVVKNRIYLYFFYTRLRKSNPVRGDRLRKLQISTGLLNKSHQSKQPRFLLSNSSENFSRWSLRVLNSFVQEVSMKDEVGLFWKVLVWE